MGLYTDYKNFAKKSEETDGTTREDWEAILNSWGDFVKNGGRKYEQFCEVANEKFPSSSGFFFGGTGYDVWYIRELFINLENFKETYNDINWDEDEVDYWEWY